jgi:hypothetical protein
MQEEPLELECPFRRQPGLNSAIRCLNQFNVDFTGLQIGANSFYGEGGQGDQHLLFALFHQFEIVERRKHRFPAGR